jgi:ABC-type multidrug transport system ATPase subunit
MAVMGVCDQVIVLDFGKLIAAGSPEEVRADRSSSRTSATTAKSTPATAAACRCSPISGCVVTAARSDPQPKAGYRPQGDRGSTRRARCGARRNGAGSRRP